jgi:hypothetical protein
MNPLASFARWFIVALLCFIGGAAFGIRYQSGVYAKQRLADSEQRAKEMFLQSERYAHVSSSLEQRAAERRQSVQVFLRSIQHGDAADCSVSDERMQQLFAAHRAVYGAPR